VFSGFFPENPENFKRKMLFTAFLCILVAVQPKAEL